MSSRNVANFGSPIPPARTVPREQRLTGGETELGAQEMEDTGGIGRLLHLARLVGIGGERLLAHDMAPGRHRLEHQVPVCVRRRRHAHHVDPGQQECVGEGDQRVRYPESTRSLPGPIGFAPHERLHLKAGGLQGPHMRQAPESGSHDHCAQCVPLLPHRCPPVTSPRIDPTSLGS